MENLFTKAPSSAKLLGVVTQNAPQRLSQIDTYIAEAQPFAQPILTHLRESLHRAVPDVEEAMKWSRPFFLYRGVILGNFAAFKEHCSFGLWGGEMAELLRADGIDASESMGTFGRIVALDDLPPRAKLEGYIRYAASLIGEGKRTKSIQRVAKPARPVPAIPPAFATALEKCQGAAQHFAALSPSCRREYMEWIAGAKREETRDKRIAKAIEEIAKGKTLNERYAARP